MLQFSTHKGLLQLQRHNNILFIQNRGGGETNMKNNNLAETIKELMKKEDRKDPEFRLAILLSEIGDIAKYITHDPKLNPNARPHGSAEDEKLAYGQVIVQLMGLMDIRRLEYDQALEKGLSNWLDADWRKRQASKNYDGTLEGIVIKPGSVKAKAYVVSDKHPIEEVKNQKSKPIVILDHADPDIIIYLEYAAGFVTDHGGKTCHLAVLAMDTGVSPHLPPSIIGTGNATEMIKHGENISLSGGGIYGKGYVKKA